MNQPHEHAALIKLWADGVAIECCYSRGPGAELWSDVNATFCFWSSEVQYRVKPKPKVKKYRYVFKNDAGRLEVTTHHYRDGVTYVGYSAAVYAAVQRIDSTMIEVDDE